MRKFTGLYTQMYKSYKYYKSILICISEWILPLEGWFYQKWSHIDNSSKLKLFRGNVHTKNGERLRASGGLSYTRMRELFLKRVSGLGYDPKHFGLHSL